MPIEPYVIENFALGTNNAPDAEDLFINEMFNIQNMVNSKPGQLITAGKESGSLKTLTAYETLPGINLFHVMLDKNLAKVEGETEWILVGDKDSGDIAIVQYNSANEGQSAISGGSFNDPATPLIACGGGSGFIMSAYVFDGAIRVCDASFGGTPRWFGYILKNWFVGATATAFDNYYDMNGGLPKITDQSFTFTALDHNDTHTTSANAIIAQLKFQNDPEKGNYQWKKKFQLAASVVYDGTQESLLSVATKIIDGEDAGIADPARGQIKVSLGSNFGANFNKRATDIKIYMREFGTELWYLQARFNLSRGGSLPHLDDFQVWTYASSAHWCTNVHVSTEDQWMEEPSMIYTYQTEAGHDPEIKYLDFARATEGWKTSCVVGRTVYLGYTKRYGEEGGVPTNGDALWKSLPNQPDKFIPINMNIAVKDDGENVIKTIAGSGAVFEFKEKTMRIVNVSQEIETIDLTVQANGGIVSADKAIDTPFGPVWINRYGMFSINENGLIRLFERQSIDKTKRPTIDPTYWATVYDDGDCALQYDPYKRQILISNYGANGSSTNPGIIFDMVSKSWTKLYNRIAQVSSNMVLDSKGNIVFSKDVGANCELRVFDFDEASSDKIRIETPETHFKHGSGTYKYVYRVLIKYKHSNATTLNNNVEMMRDGDAATFRLVGTMAQATSWAWASYVMPSSAVFEKVDTCRLDIGGYNYSAGEVAIDTKLRVAKILIFKRNLPNYRVVA